MKTILRLLCCGILFFCSDIAGGGYYDHYYPWNYCYQSWDYSQYSIPYFALHPPVYYSYHIARTYGDSPFPYRPGMRPYLACSSAPSPKIIKNEYVSGAAPAPSEPLHQTHQPL